MNKCTCPASVDITFTGHLPDCPQPAAELRELNKTPLLCRSAVREFLLEAAKQHRPFNKFNRVSEDTLIAANAQLRAWCVARVKSAPSKGVTL